MNLTFIGSCTRPIALHKHVTPRMPRSARIVLRMLSAIKIGSLTVHLPDGGMAHFGDNTEPTAHISLKSWRVFDAALKSGDIGFAETYMAGEWSSPDLVALLELIIANRKILEDVFYGSWWGTLAQRIRHLFNRNTQTQAKKNIQAHYDLGNDFYRLWLDQSMTYSAALFSGDKAQWAKQDLLVAQGAKYERVLNELAVHAGARVLEVGCGWGGFAEIATRAGVAVKGLTLSEEQLAFAKKRVRSTYAEFKLQDYRNEQGQYDGIASIEMFEAVGETYWPGYFECIKRNLKPGARACIQTIVIADELFERYRKGTDFIQQYIFPGGMLPSPCVFRSYAERAGLRVLNEFSFGDHYAETLGRWRVAFMSRLNEVKEQGYDERFIRTWEFYLAYCEAAFAGGDTSVMQFTLQA